MSNCGLEERKFLGVCPDKHGLEDCRLDGRRFCGLYLSNRGLKEYKFLEVTVDQEGINDCMFPSLDERRLNNWCFPRLCFDKCGVIGLSVNNESFALQMDGTALLCPQVLYSPLELKLRLQSSRSCLLKASNPELLLFAVDMPTFLTELLIPVCESAQRMTPTRSYMFCLLGRRIVMDKTAGARTRMDANKEENPTQSDATISLQAKSLKYADQSSSENLANFSILTKFGLK